MKQDDTTVNPYESPKVECSQQQPPTPERNWSDYSPEYNRAMLAALAMQGVLAVLAALVLDGGHTFRAFMVALLCQWATVWIILFRRPMNPSRLDLAIVRYGIIPLLVIVAGFGPVLLRFLRIAP